MSASVVGIEKPVVIDRKQNLREHRLYWVGRRTQDVVLSALALVVLSPVMLATAIAIVVDDPSAGPIFSQERIGRDGKPFRLYKFRSMCPNAEAKLDDLLDQNEMDKNGRIAAKVTVKNTGDAAGCEVVQMYIRDDYSDVVRPVKELKGFRKVELAPGEEQEVTFYITEEDLRYYRLDGTFGSEPGTFTVMIGNSSTTENSAVFTLTPVDKKSPASKAVG